MLMAVMCVLLSCTQLVHAKLSDDATAVSSDSDQALVILSTLDMPSFHKAVALVRDRGGEVPWMFYPNAFIVTHLNLRIERALERHPTVMLLEKDVVDPVTFAGFGGQAEDAANTWNTLYLGIPDPNAPPIPNRLPLLKSHEPLFELHEPDFTTPPPAQEDGQLNRNFFSVAAVVGTPTADQTSEFMAGKIVYTVVFLESSGGTGFCSPADLSTENWTSSRQNTVLTEIRTGLGFWTLRRERPSLSFIQDPDPKYHGKKQPTSCEPITRPSSDQGLWIADALTAMGFPATPNNYISIARSFVNSRRTAVGADWGFVIFVVDSAKDQDGSFDPDPTTRKTHTAFTTPYGPYPNGPYMVLTYDLGKVNGQSNISRMDRVVAHETGHIFGALDEAVGNCFPTDSSGYLNVVNASCNNGGKNGVISIMGEGWEVVDTNADVSTSARGAIGWRNPDPPKASIAIVDVVRTATVSLTPYTPDPTTIRAPTYRAIAGNKPFPPGGCNIIGGICRRTPLEANICTVKGAKWKIENYNSIFIQSGLKPDDGAFDEIEEAYTFTQSSQLQPKTYTFSTYSINNYNHISTTQSDTLTIK
jgi:hypothetical protein